MARRGKGKSGWFGDHRRHVLAGKGVSTVLPDGRRLDVSKFVAGGIIVISNPLTVDFDSLKVESPLSYAFWKFQSIIGDYKVYAGLVTEDENRVYYRLESRRSGERSQIMDISKKDLLKFADNHSLYVGDIIEDAIWTHPEGRYGNDEER